MLYMVRWIPSTYPRMLALIYQHHGSHGLEMAVLTATKTIKVNHVALPFDGRKRYNVVIQKSKLTKHSFQL